MEKLYRLSTILFLCSAMLRDTIAPSECRNGQDFFGRETLASEGEVKSDQLWGVIKNALSDSDLAHLLSATAKHAGEAIIVLDSQSRVVFWNDAATNMLGFTREEMFGQDFHASPIVPQEYKKAANRGWKRYLETGTGPLLNKSVEIEASRKNGERFMVEYFIHTTTIRGEMYAIGVMRDISVYKNLLYYVGQLEEQVKNILDNTQDAITICGLNGRFLYQNKKSEELFGRTLAELNRASRSTFVHPDFVAAASANWKTPGTSRLRCKKSNGDFIWVQETRTRVNYHDAPCIMTSIRDITSQANLEEMQSLFSKPIAQGIADYLKDYDLEQLREGRGDTFIVLIVNLRHIFLPGESSSKVFPLLNRYLSTAIPIVQRFHGVVDKVMNGAIISVFGLFDKKNAVDNALRAAFELQEHVGPAVAAFHPEATMHIGINKGEGFTGIVGGDQYSEYTVMGYIVPECYRLLALGRDANIVLTEGIFSDLPEKMKGRFLNLGQHQVNFTTEEIYAYFSDKQAAKEAQGSALAHTYGLVTSTGYEHVVHKPSTELEAKPKQEQSDVVAVQTEVSQPEVSREDEKHDIAPVSVGDKPSTQEKPELSLDELEALLFKEV